MEIEKKLYDYLIYNGYTIISNLEEEDLHLMDEDEEVLLGYIFEVEKNGIEFEIQFDIINIHDGLYAMWDNENGEDWFLGEVTI